MATSKLQEYTATLLFNAIPHLEIKENHRPYWLNGNGTGSLELDLYVPELNIAIEVQGDQHYIYIPFFHGNYNGFLEQQKRDNIKKDVCIIEGIELIEVSNYSEARQAVETTKNKATNNLTDFSISYRRNIFFRNQEIRLKSIYKNRINNLENQIQVLEAKIEQFSGTCPKDITSDIDNKIDYLTYILTELHECDEMILYRKWLRQVRGEMRQKRNSLIMEYEGLQKHRTKLGECKKKLEETKNDLDKVIDRVIKNWIKFYNEQIMGV